MAYLKASVM